MSPTSTTSSVFLFLHHFQKHTKMLKYLTFPLPHLTAILYRKVFFILYLHFLSSHSLLNRFSQVSSIVQKLLLSRSAVIYMLPNTMVIYHYPFSWTFQHYSTQLITLLKHFLNLASRIPLSGCLFCLSDSPLPISFVHCSST